MLPDDPLTSRGVIANGERYISLVDAIQLYGVSRRTLYNWMNDGKVQFAYTPGGSRYVRLSSLALKLPNGEALEIDAPARSFQFLDVR